MNKNYNYYLNKNKYGDICVPRREGFLNYLIKEKFLSEFKTDEEKLIVLDNLGVTDKVKILKNILDNKVIEIGGIPWDSEPTEGHTEQILSSDIIYKALSKYKSNETIDAIIQTLWNNVISKINSIDENIKLELLTLIPTLIDNRINERIADLLNLINALNTHGIAVSNEFGMNSHISVSQKSMTDALNNIWKKIEDMTGEVIQGFNMVATPTFFVSDDGCDVHIAANTAETNGVFEWIEFWVDGVCEKRYENVRYIDPKECVIHLENKEGYDYLIECKAQIMGIEYPPHQHIITRYNKFYIGAGSTYADVMKPAYVKQLKGTMRHNYYVPFAEGDKLIIMMGASLREGFIRADLNGAEIKMTEVKLDAEGHVIPEEDTTTEVKFIGFMSEAWSKGDYNIDING